MKKLLLIALVSIFIITEGFSQTGINSDGSPANPSAMLDIKSSVKGLLIPRLTTAQRDSVLSPATGLLVFNKTNGKFNCYNGTSWSQFETSFLSVSYGSSAPGGGVSLSTSQGKNPDNSAMLDVDDQKRGILVPRTTPAQVPNPAEGLIIYNSATNLLNLYNGSRWIALCAAPTPAIIRTGSQSQAGVAINNTGALPHQTAILDVSSASKGLLIPRMNQAQRDNILPVTGLVIYNTTWSEIEFFNGFGWFSLLPNTLPAPIPDNQFPSTSWEITWAWLPVPGAIGYRWNTTNDYNSATDLGSATSKLEQYLRCGQIYTRYVWAYNTCCVSPPVMQKRTPLSCQTWNCGDAINDSRDGQLYNTLLIGLKCWMKENLNLGVRINGNLNQTSNSIIEKFCYNNLDSNCSVYGGLYQWNEMMNYTSSSNTIPSGRQGICPAGWHVPSSAEWCQMTKFLDASSPCNVYSFGGIVGALLKESGTTHWAIPNDATNSSGFTALPGGMRNGLSSNFELHGTHSYFWSSMENDPIRAVGRILFNSNPWIMVTESHKPTGMALRCVKDDSCFVPHFPTGATQVPSNTQINWNWNEVPGAVTYKWNTTWDYSTATDIGLVTTKTDTGLICDTYYYRYVWAVGTCGVSDIGSIYARTLPCDYCPPITDSRDGKQYRTIIIGNQCWMQENLNTGTMVTGTQNQANNGIIEKYCYSDAASGCNEYGGMYQWAELVQYLNGASNTTSWNPVPSGNVTGICPAGWHIPSDAEWNTLTAYLGGSSQAGNSLKESGNAHWTLSNTATNFSGFTALGGGYRSGSGFQNILNNAWFWSGDENSGPASSSALGLSSGLASAVVSAQSKVNGNFVRCIRNCSTPYAPSSGSHIPYLDQIVWKWITVPFITGYKWNTINDYSTATDMGMNLNKYETGLSCNTAYTRYVWSYNACGNSSPVTLSCQTSSVVYPAAPVSGTHVPSVTQITWNWNSVIGAIGYKWNTMNNFATATDMGTATAVTDTGLTCNTTYTRFVWAYCACGSSTAVTLSQSTSACPFVCGASAVMINHIAGAVAPVSKTVIYGTVNNLAGEPSKCWITSNLGADHQANTVNDVTEASAGWYWQFNMKQGYKHDGTSRTPNSTWITYIGEYSDWLSSNDPCSLEIGDAWHIPTYTEWFNIDNSNGWINWNGPWNSALKLHASGYLNINGGGALSSRGLLGYYWSSTQKGSSNGWDLYFNSITCAMYWDPKAYGLTLRCLRD